MRRGTKHLAAAAIALLIAVGVMIHLSADRTHAVSIVTADLVVAGAPSTVAAAREETDRLERPSSAQRAPVLEPAPEPSPLDLRSESFPKIEHAWDSIGGLTTPDRYPDAGEIVASPVFNPRRIELDEVRLADLRRLLDQLAPNLDARLDQYRVQLGDAVTLKIERGELEPSTTSGMPDLGCIQVTRGNRDGKISRVQVRPLEFAGLDRACEAARLEARNGDRRIQAFFRTLE